MLEKEKESLLERLRHGDSAGAVELIRKTEGNNYEGFDLFFGKFFMSVENIHSLDPFKDYLTEERLDDIIAHVGLRSSMRATLVKSILYPAGE